VRAPYTIKAVPETATLVPDTMLAMSNKGLGRGQNRDSPEALWTAESLVSQPKGLLDGHGIPAKLASRVNSAPLPYFNNNHSGHRTPCFSIAY
jgi:hypothetical protein